MKQSKTVELTRLSSLHLDGILGRRDTRMHARGEYICAERSERVEELIRELENCHSRHTVADLPCDKNNDACLLRELRPEFNEDCKGKDLGEVAVHRYAHRTAVTQKTVDR